MSGSESTKLVSRTTRCETPTKSHPLTARTGVPAFRYVAEAVTLTAIAFAFGHAVGVENSGVVSVFLGSAGLSKRFQLLFRRAGHLLRRTRETMAFLKAGRWIAVDIASLGLGVFLAYLGVCLLVGPGGVEQRFGFAMTVAGVDEHGFHLVETGGVSLLGRKLMALLSVFLLAFVYRGFGALLALMWNAAAWAVALYCILHADTIVDGNPGVPVVVAAAAVAPQLALEALGYGSAALAGVRAGMDLGSARDGFVSIAALMAIACTLIIGAWLAEMTWPGIVFRFLDGGP